MVRRPTIAILGASGLIGDALASSLSRRGFGVVPIARRFTAAQEAAFGDNGVESPIVSLDTDTLASLIDDCDVVVNCVGVLQDSGRGTTADVHEGFVARLVAALERQTDPALLVHISIPGEEADDRTDFSATKRAAERLITASAVPHAILRPGMVIAPTAYGGSALMRALAILPVDLPAREAKAPLAATAIEDIAATIAFLAERRSDGEHEWSATWDVMARKPSTVGDVVAAFRHRLGGPSRRIGLPSWLMALGARLGDLAAHLDWSPPVRSTALAELRRGVAGDPAEWIAATGIEPATLEEAVRATPATVQEKWFASLYAIKAIVLVSLVVFWSASGLIALTIAFDAATSILTGGGFPEPLARTITVVSSLADIAVGLAIAFRRTCRTGLVAGVGLSLFYMGGAVAITPELWIEPLGALVKTIPAIVLMLVALATLEDR